MRPIFFAGDKFSLHGVGDFTGTFHMFKGGRELKGSFYSEEAGVNQFRFPNLEGDLIWVPDRMEVTRATSGFYGGQTSFKYRMAPLGKPAEPIRSRFDVEYTDVDLLALTNLLETEGLRIAGGPPAAIWWTGRTANGPSASATATSRSWRRPG